MPDQWGRPTFNDGMAIAQGLRSVTQDMQKRNIAEIAQKVAENPEWRPGEGENYTPEALYQGRIRGIAAYMDKLSLSEAQMKEKVARYELERTELEKRIVPLLADDSPEGRTKLYKAFSEYSGSGITIAPADEGKIEVTYPDGRKSVQQAPSSEQITQMLQSILDPRGFINQRLAWDRYAKETNIELLLRAKDLRDPKSGNPIKVKFTQQIDPSTHKLRPVYINVATEMELNEAEIKDLHKKGLITADDMMVTLELQKKAMEARKAQYDLLKSMYGAKKAESESAGKGGTEKDGDKTLNTLYKEVRDNFGVRPNDVDDEGKPLAVTEKVGIDVRNYLRGKGYDAKFESIGKDQYVLRFIQKGLRRMDYGMEDVGGAGLMSAEQPSAKAPTPKPSAEKSSSVPQRKEGESIEAFLQRTGAGTMPKPGEAGAAEPKKSKNASGNAKEVSQTAGWIIENPARKKVQFDRIRRQYKKPEADAIIKEVEKRLKEDKETSGLLSEAGKKKLYRAATSFANSVNSAYEGTPKATQPW